MAKNLYQNLPLIITTLGLSLLPTISNAQVLTINNYGFDRGEFSLIVAQNPTAIDLMNQGFTLHNNQEFEEAIDFYDQALALEPDFLDAWFAKGMALSELENYQGAITAFDRVIEINHKYADAYAMRGGVYVFLDQLEKAKKDLELAAQLYQEQNNSDQYQDTLSLLQIIESVQGNPSANNENDEVEFDPNSPYALFDRAFSFYESKEYSEAITALDQAIAIKPDFAEAYGLRGGAHYFLGHQEKALTDLEIASQLFQQQNNIRGYEKTRELIEFFSENLVSE